jgi:mannose-6-phosphate isomerase-like protein (cupin superfamily)
MSHNQIKTYTFSEAVTDNRNFIMKRAEDVYFNGEGESDSPHRHDYYAIVLIEKGKGVHYVDFQKYELQDNTLYFILPGQMHQLIPSEKPKGWVLAFTEEFSITNSISDKTHKRYLPVQRFMVSPLLSYSSRHK